ncbi:transglutaminaseTgpA domain-containing protein [Actinomadura napierensis]|uniref:Transglutaminase-like domain-containing protein n=1 Tax=Actinomadura napierensis TaxID=267854 RepID=A0ABN3A647_9ACTN
MTRYASLVVTACLCAVSGLAFQRVFGLGPVLPVAMVATAVPTVLSGLLSGPRKGGRPWPLWLSLVLTVVAWAGTAAVTVLRPALGDGTFPQALREGVLGSWKSILTTLLPAPAKPEYLLLVHALVWLAAFASAELALRTPLRALPAVPPLGVWAAALLLGVDGPGSNLPLAAVTVVLVAVLVLVRADGPASGPVWRPLLAGLPAAAVLGALALALGPVVPVSADPYDPREQVQAPPPQQRDSVSPLDRVGGWLLSPDQVMFTVRSKRTEIERLAVLDAFDGVTWTSTARFVPTGSRVPEGPKPRRKHEVAQRVTIGALPGVYVPAPDRPREVDGLGVVADPAGGALAAAEPLRPGQTYTVTSEVPEWSADDLAGAGVADDAEARADRRLPWGPGATRPPVQLAEFRGFAQAATQGAASPIQKAAMLAEYLKRYAKYDVTAPPGHSYRQLDYFLGEGRRGTPEHFATAYALLARTLGLPSRVVVGFDGGNRAGNTVQYRSGDVMVWPEVKFAGLGWIRFNPLPDSARRSKSNDAVAAGETEKKLEQAQKNAASQTRGSGAGKTPRKTPPKPAAAHDAPTPWWVLASLAGAALVLAYLLAVLLAPALRRRRRRTGEPGDRITGAWHQALDHLADVGLATARTLTAHEVARFGASAVGEDARGHLGPLAELVDRSRFAPARPDPRAAEEAWHHTDQLGRLVTARAGRLRRLRRRLHPRSLRDRRASAKRGG